MKPFTLSGEVVRGEGLGRRLGFPTANLMIPERDIPERGVYKVSVELERAWPALCNVGVRPTVSGGDKIQVEVHIPGFFADIYGKVLTVVFLEKIREERKFPSVEALKEQLARDVAALG